MRVGIMAVCCAGAIAGCGPGANVQALRARAAFDFQCPAAEIQITQIVQGHFLVGEGAVYGAVGCGRRGTSLPEWRYWLVRSSRRPRLTSTILLGNEYVDRPPNAATLLDEKGRCAAWFRLSPHDEPVTAGRGEQGSRQITPRRAACTPRTRRSPSRCGGAASRPRAARRRGRARSRAGSPASSRAARSRRGWSRPRRTRSRRRAMRRRRSGASSPPCCITWRAAVLSRTTPGR